MPTGTSSQVSITVTKKATKRYKNPGYPLILKDTTEYSQAVAAAWYDHVEHGSQGGYFPMGSNTVWHGGVHLKCPRGTPVFAVFNGTVIAARLSAKEKDAYQYYGSKNFVLISHEIPGSKLIEVIGGDEANTGAHKLDGKKLYTFYSLYLHLDCQEPSETNTVLASVPFLINKTQTDIICSVGNGGKNDSADVKLVQERLKAHGKYDGSITGNADDATIKAIDLPRRRATVR